MSRITHERVEMGKGPSRINFGVDPYPDMELSLTRDIDIAVLSVRPSVYPFVCPSVTCGILWKRLSTLL